MTIDDLKYKHYDLIPVIVQDDENGDVLMLGYMDRAALDKTIETGLVHYYSRSRQEHWLKGGTSGHYQHVRSIRTDCDRDTLLIRVTQDGAACHEGYRSCFSWELDDHGRLNVVAEKVFDPKEVYARK
ncbi:MAG: phosphoribosyl-AMP cyclohydrolase [Armatimonadota bacterium]